MVSTSIAFAAPFDPALLSGPAAADADRDWRGRAAGWAGAGLSVAVLGLIAHALGSRGLDGLLAHTAGSPAFWAVFVLAYLASPACEWVIFHQLWRLPASGALALLRKEVSNELLFGYSGEAQFYLWARRHVPMNGSPFGAVKDVAVLSALAGNIATLALMTTTAPTLAKLAVLPGAKALGGSVAIVIAISLALFLLRRTVFSLPAPALRMVFAVHAVRIALHVGLTALMWHLLLPSVPLGSWMLLATLRQMTSRLPLVANKDLLFAGMALLLLGPAGGVTAVVATVSGLIVAAHLVVGLFVYAAQLAPRMVRW